MTPLDGIRCVVADDHPAILRALGGVLAAEGVEVVGQASDGFMALAAIRVSRPDIALLDDRMPGRDGIEVARQILLEGLPTAVILYTGFASESRVAEALAAGVRGFVVKDADLTDVLAAIRAVACGQPFVDPSLGMSLLAAGGRRAGQLSPREREILRLLADGLNNTEIGRRLFIAPETVRTHIRNAMSKLNAHTRAQAVATALRLALIH